MLARWPWHRVIAHRCGGALAPENTLAGLRIAAAIGAAAVEFDVMLSRDGIPVVIHDELLDRTSTASGAVAARDYEALADCDVGARHHRAFAGERLPSFEAVARLCRQLGLAANVELKCSEADGEALGLRVARDANRWWQGSDVPPLLSSFAESALRAARREAPELPRALLVETLPSDWRDRVGALGCISLNCDVNHLTPELIDEVHGHGVRLAAYTENNPERALRWFAAGADALFTDRPDLLLAVEPGEIGRERGALP